MIYWCGDQNWHCYATGAIPSAVTQLSIKLDSSFFMIYLATDAFQWCFHWSDSNFRFGQCDHMNFSAFLRGKMYIGALWHCWTSPDSPLLSSGLNPSLTLCDMCQMAISLYSLWVNCWSNSCCAESIIRKHKNIFCVLDHFQDGLSSSKYSPLKT